MGNLTLAWRNARKGKSRKKDVVEFERNLEKNLLALHTELTSKTYMPRPLVAFVVRDPKTRKIAKSDIRDRIVHHALINIIGPIFERMFIYDSCANRKGKGTLFALWRFYYYLRKVTLNRTREAYCLKADVKKYFENVNHLTLINIIRKKIADENTLELIQKINANFGMKRERERECVTSWLEPKGMPLGNLTSQFFANVYLNELDYFVKHVLKIECYIRYVDDFVILHESREQLEKWKSEINYFLQNKLKLTLHPQKSRIASLSSGVDFVGFRNFYYHCLLRKRSLRKMMRKIEMFHRGEKDFGSLMDNYQGWQAHAQWAHTRKTREKIRKLIAGALLERI